MSELQELAKDALQACAARKILLTLAESCTGGMIASALTDIAGSSAVFERGFVTYSNEAKVEMLGVSNETLKRHGAVSRETAVEMAEGALSRSKADVALSVTGIAGPGGGSEGKPVGLVWFALARSGFETVAEKRPFENRGRDFIRREAAKHALSMVRNTLEPA